MATKKEAESKTPVPEPVTEPELPGQHEVSLKIDGNTYTVYAGSKAEGEKIIRAHVKQHAVPTE